MTPTAGDFVGGQGAFAFPHGVTVYRVRAGTVENPYSGKEVPADWSSATETQLTGGAINTSSSYDFDDPRRNQINRIVDLVFDNPSVDLRLTDRVKIVQNGETVLFKIVGIPARDVNPFTGWQPTLVVRLEQTNG